MSRYLLSAEAESDLDEIRAYLMQQGGTRLVRYVFDRIARFGQSRRNRINPHSLFRLRPTYPTLSNGRDGSGTTCPHALAPSIQAVMAS